MRTVPLILLLCACKPTSNASTFVPAPWAIQPSSLDDPDFLAEWTVATVTNCPGHQCVNVLDAGGCQCPESGHRMTAASIRSIAGTPPNAPAVWMGADTDPVKDARAYTAMLDAFGPMEGGTVLLAGNTELPNPTAHDSICGVTPEEPFLWVRTTDVYWLRSGKAVKLDCALGVAVRDLPRQQMLSEIEMFCMLDEQVVRDAFAESASRVPERRAGRVTPGGAVVGLAQADRYPHCVWEQDAGQP